MMMRNSRYSVIPFFGYSVLKLCRSPVSNEIPATEPIDRLNHYQPQFGGLGL
jgi:hypothetical protein